MYQVGITANFQTVASFVWIVLVIAHLEYYLNCSYVALQYLKCT